MSSWSEYTEGVPVKISERFKPPPRIELGRAVAESAERARAALRRADYSFRFESRVLGKLAELRAAKETLASERRHRLRLLDEAEQRRLDELAAREAQERLQQLNVSEVSYPSAEEIGEISTEVSQEDAAELTAPVGEVADDSNGRPITNTADSRTNILQPIQLSSRQCPDNLLDDPDPLQDLKMNSKNCHYYASYRNSNVDQLTFSDFENDTSSPFDNMELKTINDLELLAQVLQNCKDASVNCNLQQNPMDLAPAPLNYNSMMSECISSQPMPGNVYLPTATYSEQPIISHSNPIYSSPQHYTVPAQYYANNENICDNTMPIENLNNMYMPGYNFYAPSNMYGNPQPMDGCYGSLQTTATQSGMLCPVPQVPINDAVTYAPHSFNYYNYPQVSTGYAESYNTSQNEDVLKPKISTNVSQVTIKSRSRSVPDIVKELSDEVASERLRADERSHNASPAPRSSQPTPSASVAKKVSRKMLEKLPNPYDKLPLEMQEMCRNIEAMGFPLDRVARVCTLLGDNDKKVIEVLLLMGQLMDLGFTESKVSTALAKHEFDRDKALDELIS